MANPRSPVVRKPSAATTYASKYTLTERKLLNVCLYVAQEEGFDANREYEVDVDDVLVFLGESSSKNSKWLKDALRGLVTKPVEWDVLERDRTQDWGICTLLQSSGLRSGRIRWRLNAELVHRFANPELFSRFRILAQVRMSRRHALALWEYCINELSLSGVKDGEGVVFKESLSNIRRLLGFEDGQYAEFKALNQLVLGPAVDEINEVSDIHLSMKLIRRHRIVEELEFEASRKAVLQLSLDFPDRDWLRSGKGDAPSPTIDRQTVALAERLVEYNVAQHQAMRLARQYEAALIEGNLAYVDRQLSKQSSKIKSVPAYVVNAIEKNYAKIRGERIIDIITDSEPSDVAGTKHSSSSRSSPESEFWAFRQGCVDALIAKRSPSWKSKLKKKFLAEMANVPADKQMFEASERTWSQPTTQAIFANWVAGRFLTEPHEIDLKAYISWKSNQIKAA